MIICYCRERIQIKIRQEKKNPGKCTKYKASVVFSGVRTVFLPSADTWQYAGNIKYHQPRELTQALASGVFTRVPPHHNSWLPTGWSQTPLLQRSSFRTQRPTLNHTVITWLHLWSLLYITLLLSHLAISYPQMTLSGYPAIVLGKKDTSTATTVLELRD